MCPSPFISPLAQPTDARWCRLLCFICSTFVERVLSVVVIHSHSCSAIATVSIVCPLLMGWMAAHAKKRVETYTHSTHFLAPPFIESAVVCLSTPPFFRLLPPPLLCLDPWALEAGAPARVIFWWLFAKNYRVKLGKCFSRSTLPSPSWFRGSLRDSDWIWYTWWLNGSRWRREGSSSSSSSRSMHSKALSRNVVWMQSTSPPHTQTCLARVMHWAGVLKGKHHQWRWQWNGEGSIKNSLIFMLKRPISRSCNFFQPVSPETRKLPGNFNFFENCYDLDSDLCIFWNKTVHDSDFNC